MTTAFVAAAAVFGELLFMFIIGGLIPFAAKGEKRSFAESMCSGWIVTAAATEAVSVAALRMQQDLSWFCYGLAGVLACLAALSIVVGFPRIFRGTAVISGGFSFRFSAFLAALFALLLTALMLVLPAKGDPGQTIARLAKDLYTDTYGAYVPGTGEQSARTLPETLLRYYGLDALVCRLTGLPAMVEMKLVRSAVTQLVASLAVYRIFYRITEGNTLRAALAAALAFAAALASRTFYTPSGILFSRGWTGEAALACVLLPLILLLAQSLYDNPSAAGPQILAVLCGIAAVSFTSSALLLAPLMMAACLIPVALIRKKWTLLLVAFAGAAVPLIVILMYMNALAAPAL